jgi:hypothetical protein
MNVEGLRDRLRQAGVEATPRELAESLWLAARMRPPAAPETPAADEPPVPRTPEEPVAPPGSPSPSSSPPVLPPIVPPPVAEAPGVELHSAGPVPERPRAAEPVEVPKPIALGERLAFQRALRPLLRRVPVRGIGTLNEEATARFAAEHPVGAPWPPVLQRPRELWLDAVVVVDCGDSMAIWQDLATEVIATLTESGVFRQVARYRLEGADGSATLADWRGRACRPAQLTDPGNRRVILVVSDCVGRMWRSGAAGAMLHEWGRRGPVAILQPLPERLWARTGARTVAGRITAPRACAPNADLSFAAFGGRAVAEGVRVPVLELSGRWLRRWTSLIAGGPPETGAVTVVGGEAVPLPVIPAPRTVSAGQRVRQFRAVASGEAFRLARYIALSEPVLPVIRHVHTAMFRPAEPAHLAEVLLSGLLRVVDSGQGRYRFVEGVPEVLLETLTVSETMQARDLLEKVSASVQRQMSASRAAFTAFTPAGGSQLLDERSRPFAIISAVGKDRVRLAHRQLDRPEPPPEPPSESRPGGEGPDDGDVRPVPSPSVDLARLLEPETAAIAFRGREVDLAALTAWCAGEGTAVMLVTGAAGSGKTRIAAELATHLRRAGWPGRLVVVDRADVRPGEVAAAVRSSGSPLRVLLIARAAGGWWRDQQALDDTGLLAAATTHELGPYCHRRSWVEFIRRAIADLTALVFPDGPEPRAFPDRAPLTGNATASPLDIAVAAALWLLGAEATAVVDALVEGERRYAERSAARTEISFPAAAVLDRYLAAAQLYGAGSAADARDVVRLVAGSEGRDAATVRRIASWLHDFYPGTDGDYWSVLPGPVRERLVLATVLAAPQIVAILAPVSEPQARRALATLVPACGPFPQLAAPVWAAATRRPALCGAALEVARRAGDLPAPLLALARGTMTGPETPVALLRAIVDGVGDVAVLFDRRGPREAEQLTAAFERLAAASAPHLPLFADAVYHCGLISERAGLSQEALRTAGTEIDLRRRIVSGAGAEEAATGALARALITYAVRLDRNGSPVAGLAAAAEAVLLYERVDDAAGHACALVEQSRLLGRLDRREEALESAHRGAARFRELGDAAGLADALLVEAAQARSLGQAEPAVVAGAEAVRTLERLAQGDPERYTARYAYACTVHGMDLGDFRSHTAGLDRLDRAATLYRALSDRDPAHRPGLAAAHTGRGVLLTELARHEAAGAAFAEVTTIYRALAEADPAGFERPLAGALTVQAEALAAAGRVAEGVPVMIEAGERLEALHRADPLDSSLREELAAAYLILAGLHEGVGAWAAATECRLRSRLLLGG